MPGTETQAAPKQRSSGVAEFTVEFGDERNRSVVVSTFREKMRGHFSMKKFYDSEAGGRDIGAAMQRVPDIPGQFMRVIPKDRQVIVYDPWENKPQEWRRLNASLADALPVRSGNYGPIPRQERTLSDDQLKTLVIELVRKCESGTARVVKGTLPSNREIESMPGRQLHDPLNSGRKPRYQDEREAWESRLDTA